MPLPGISWSQSGRLYAFCPAFMNTSGTVTAGTADRVQGQRTLRQNFWELSFFLGHGGCGVKLLCELLPFRLEFALTCIHNYTSLSRAPWLSLRPMVLDQASLMRGFSKSERHSTREALTTWITINPGAHYSMYYHNHFTLDCWPWP
jgi:hypothetical protein